jgi:hypothetical protein
MADILLPTYHTETTLPSGKVAALTREALGRDVETASAVIGMAKLSNPMSLMLALFAQVGRIDGAPIVYEDLLDLPWADTIAIMGLMGADPEKK